MVEGYNSVASTSILWLMPLAGKGRYPGKESLVRPYSWEPHGIFLQPPPQDGFNNDDLATTPDNESIMEKTAVEVKAVAASRDPRNSPEDWEESLLATPSSDEESVVMVKAKSGPTIRSIEVWSSDRKLRGERKEATCSEGGSPNESSVGAEVKDDEGYEFDRTLSPLPQRNSDDTGNHRVCVHEAGLVGVCLAVVSRRI